MSPITPKLKLTHFDVRARAEATRITLHVGGIPFEDERIPFVNEHDLGETWKAVKHSTPFDQIPVMTVNGTTQIAQSNAILRYAGIVSGMYPADDALKAALVDQMVMHVDDMTTTVIHTIFEADAHKKMMMRKAIADEKFPAMFTCMDKVIGMHSGGKWAVGDCMTIADISVYVLVVMIKSGLWDNIPVNAADKFARVNCVYEAVRTHPKVAEWEVAHVRK
ncbi:hypothetical protein BASA50_010795 [Batrachochytrium salamandrivorans]|uniref:Glutathione S-transferase n=1 Tax=Batrachochytrium salamandrivorans TaxID=1357716 RepID=A0ABQ8F0B9_9FUNG|nr:hypothetical protein BASA60_000105 [Batrachochytrium salamandrivorans]KAH6575491.1 hypothetical protein BASA62_001882 [Batrachochytrium salamandrivorans]KAH6588307.1 hypothetical protein BASA50_010782 [Batrachochytrium salamandrivorans]KAH6588320.1 hypothetical protein BASA50_010795 [Batrachochytrium salamandrivorans]KAH6591677.1 hypothetical protein BASA61_004876 [Batrachochytrium salamandrivorans]